MENVNSRYEIESLARQMNSSLPKKVDDITTASKVEYIYIGNKLVFDYKVETLKSEIEPSQIQDKIDELKSSQISYAKIIQIIHYL